MNTQVDLNQILLSRQSYIDFNRGLQACTRGILTIDKSISEVADFFYPQEAFDREYKECKYSAVDWLPALKVFIAEISLSAQKDRIGKEGYRFGLAKINPQIYSLDPDFIYWDKAFIILNHYQNTEHYLSLSRGYRIAINLSRLDKEIELLESKLKGTPPETKDPNFEKKLLVKCNLAQFATVIEMLMERGYIQHTNNAEGTARILLRSFEFEDFPNVSIESLGKKFFKDPAINATDFAEIREGKIPYRKYLKGTKDV